MHLDTLLARATALPGFELWRGLAPRRFLVEHLLADLITAMEVLPADHQNGLFAVITTSPHGLPETLPAGWSEVDRLGEYFATFRAPEGTTAREVIETLALELVPLFYPSEVFEDKLFDWLEDELGPEEDENEEIEYLTDDHPHLPGNFDYLSEKSEREQDLDFLYGSGSTPPQYHGYNDRSAYQDPTYGPPEVSDVDIQYAEETSLLYC